MTSAKPMPEQAARQEFRRRLEDSRAELLRTLALTDEETAARGGEGPSSFGDVAAEEAGRSLLGELGGKERRELDEISDALARLETGTYGLCERCGRSVARERLRAVPATRYCVECQSREEASR